MKRWIGLVAAGMLAAGSAASARDEAAKPAAPIKIGAIFAVTGPSAFLGGPEARTAQMMVEDINANHCNIRQGMMW